VLVTAFTGTGPKFIPATASEFSSDRIVGRSFVPIAHDLGPPNF
jgi:hypothetical protein